MSKKIKSRNEIAKIAARARRRGKTVGFTNGCFDILHAGHVKYLQKAKEKCDILMVGVNSDSSVRSIKGTGRPVNKEKDRAVVLAALECVDYLTLFDEDTPENLIRALSPDVLFKGGDWDADEVAGGSFVKSKGGKVVIVSFVPGYSTTALLKKISGKQNG